MNGLESSAIQLLKRAVELDKAVKYGESLACYEQGIRLLLQAAKDVEDKKKKEHYHKKVEEYLARAEVLKKLKKKEAEKKEHKQLNIPKGATGHGYATLVGPYLNEEVTATAIRDPYIRSTGQLYNLQRFCEVLVQGAPNLRSIFLLTSRDPSKNNEQQNGLEEIQQCLSVRGVKLCINYSNTLHDREIRFNTGWTIQIGRGLDYFQRLQGGRFAIGSGNYDLRPCMETTVDIFHQDAVIDDLA